MKDSPQPPVFSPKPLRRSLTFWLGLTTFSFLLWFWADSFFHATWIVLPKTPPKEAFEITTLPGRLEIEWSEGAWLAWSPPVRRFDIRRGPQRRSVDDLWRPYSYGSSDGQRFFPAPGSGWKPGSPIPPGTPSAPIRMYRSGIALWMPPAAFLLIWIPILVLGRRRQGRIAAKLASIPEPALTN